VIIPRRPIQSAMNDGMSASTDTRQNILDAARNLVAGRGWSAVGLSEVLAAASVPKGSFYHWFSSKDAFGQAMLDSYFADYLQEMDAIFSREGTTAAERLMAYWNGWISSQSLDDCQGRCLAVKLAAEVADLSESMRLSLLSGTTGIIDRIRRMIEAGMVDGSLAVDDEPGLIALSLYEMWVGASILAKIRRDAGPMDGALATTRRLLDAG